MTIVAVYSNMKSLKVVQYRSGFITFPLPFGPFNPAFSTPRIIMRNPHQAK